MTTTQILARFPQLSALVVGDICLDRWCVYDPAAAEPSRETGIPRVGVVSTETTPGAGGTVANNLASLRVGRIAVLGAIGEDGTGWELRQALAARRIDDSRLVLVKGAQTFTYTKLINKSTGQEDLPRLDFINVRPLPADAEAAILQRLRSSVAGFDVIIVADQAETDMGGVVTPAVREALSELARRNPQKIFWVDSRMRCELFRDVIVKPNQREAEEACLRLLGRVDFAALRTTIGPRPLIVTHGAQGAQIWDELAPVWVHTKPAHGAVDICGAGDSFTAGAAMAMAVTRSAVEAARIGNLVAYVTIHKPGTGTASPEEVLTAAQ